MKITAITPQKRNKNFFNIFIDEEYYCSLDDESIYKMKLKAGLQIDPDTLLRASKESAYKKALNYSLNLLGRYSKTKKEMINKLKEKEYDQETTDAVVQKLSDLGYLNDEDYLDAFIRNKQENSSTLNKRTLYNKMLQKGLDKELIQEKLQNTDIDEYQNALKAAERKLRNLKGTDKEKKMKLYTYLYGKGFDYETCTKVVSNVDIPE